MDLIYFNKYQKYKQKYFNLKNQNGNGITDQYLLVGTYEIDGNIDVQYINRYFDILSKNINKVDNINIEYINTHEHKFMCIFLLNYTAITDEVLYNIHKLLKPDGVIYFNNLSIEQKNKITRSDIYIEFFIPSTLESSLDQDQQISLLNIINKYNKLMMNYKLAPEYKLKELYINTPVICSKQDGALSCGRNALNNLFGKLYFSEPDEFLPAYTEKEINSLIENISDTNKFNLHRFCKYIEPLYKNPLLEAKKDKKSKTSIEELRQAKLDMELCRLDENYNVTLLINALNILGYENIELNGKHNVLSVLLELDKYIINGKLSEILGMIINYHGSHWVCLQFDNINRKYYEKDSVNEVSIIYNSLTEYINANYHRIVEVLIIFPRYKSINLDTNIFTNSSKDDVEYGQLKENVKELLLEKYRNELSTEYIQYISENITSSDNCKKIIRILGTSVSNDTLIKDLIEYKEKSRKVTNGITYILTDKILEKIIEKY